MTRYGKTWWGKKWLETFNGIDCDNRLPRGRTYANTGRAYDIELKGNIATAKVQGSRPKPYKVEVILSNFSQKDLEIIFQTITNSPSILSGLINKKLPTKLLDKLNSHKIRLFPQNWQEIKASCSCPDWAMPCKHIAAIIYLIGAEIDKNPFVIFNIHNCDLLNMISDFDNGKFESIQKLLLVDDIFKCSEDYLSNKFDPLILQSINLSTIPNLAERISCILSNDPPFYEKDFREILQLAYKHWQKYSCGQSSRYLYSKPIISIKTDKDISEEEIFAKKWHNPESWDSFQLVIDDRHQLIQILNDNTELFQKSNNLVVLLAQFLQDIPNLLLHKLNQELRFMHMLAQFAKKLMEKSACIPQILQNTKGETLIRWIPALFDNEVNAIYGKLCSICSLELVRYKKSFLNPQEQVKTVVAIILSGYMYDNLSVPLNKHSSNDVFKLFFKYTTHKFKEFSNKEIPNVINQWLSNLYLSEKSHKLYLMIADKSEKFQLDIKISLNDKAEPIELHKALLNDDIQTKLTILSDIALLLEYIPELEQLIDEKRNIVFNFEDFAPLFLSILPVLRAIGIIIILPKPLQKILKPQLNLNLKAKDKIPEDRQSFMNLEQLLQFDWRIAIGDKALSIAEFKSLLQQSRGLVRIMDEYVLLDEKEMANLLKQLERLPEYLSQADLMQASLSGELDGAKVDIDKQLTLLFNQLGSYAQVSIPHNLTAQLRPYQERGFSWLVQNISTNFGSILADDMGLGKTLQVIATILYCKNAGFLIRDRVLIVAPTSLLSNWQREIERFAPDLNLLVYHGQNRELSGEYDLVITSYGLARRDKKDLNKLRWFLLVIDEAQNIKNPLTEQTKAIKSIEAQHKIAMSGTPVENRLLEYWSIFDFTNKRYLGTPKQFKDKFAVPIEQDRDQDCLERFKKITSPFILRRLKSDKTIIQDLPDKIENNRYCSLTPEQTAIYQEVVDMTMKKIENSDGIERKGLVLKLINALKQICNHPSQFYKKKAAYIEQSGKMQMLDEILSGIDINAEKSLIFTQYTEMGNIIAKLIEEKFKSAIPFLHGSLSRTTRDEMVADFQNCSQRRTLIISLKAGGTGLNLTAANNVIHYDLWWNPAVEAQATDRAYRIGQKSNVMVYRLITTGTFEERIDEMIQSKKELANLTVGSGENWITELSNDQLRNLFKLRVT